VERNTLAKEANAKLTEIKASLRRRRHEPVSDRGLWLQAVLRGHYRYYGVPLNIWRLQRFRWHVQRLWQRSLARRSQKGRATYARMERLAKHWLPLARIYHPRIYHPYPAQRFRGTTQGRSPVR